MMRSADRRASSPGGRRTGGSEGAGAGGRPAPDRPRNNIPFDSIHAAAAQYAAALAVRWLPGGVKKGAWWLCRVPWRQDTHPSFGLSLTTGKWQDFATGDRGDMIDLYQKRFGGTLAEAAKQVARAVGHPFGQE